jgi:hypothetical protein
MFNLNSEPSEYTLEDFAVPDHTPEQEQQKTQLLTEIQEEFERLGIDRELQEMLSYQTTGRIQINTVESNFDLMLFRDYLRRLESRRVE